MMMQKKKKRNTKKWRLTTFFSATILRKVEVFRNWRIRHRLRRGGVSWLGASNQRVLTSPQSLPWMNQSMDPKRRICRRIEGTHTC